VGPRLGKAEPFAPLIFTLASIFLVVIPTVLIAVQAVQSITRFLSRDWTSTFDRLQSSMTNGVDIFGRRVHIGGEQLQAVVQDVGQRAATFAAGYVGGLATTVPSAIIFLFLFIIALYYCLRDGSAFGRWLLRLSPFPEQETRELFASVQETVNGAILGLIATALVQGGLTLIALYIFDVPNAFLLGVLATALSFIPLVGTTPVTIGSAIYLFMTGRIGGFIGMLVAAAIIGVADNIVRPWVQSSQTRMHPLIALLGIFGGLELFGAAGVFLGPVVAAMAIWTIDAYAKLHPPRREPASLPEGVIVVRTEPPPSQKEKPTDG
jgi:predicted PurR-regulated permease PerM